MRAPRRLVAVALAAGLASAATSCGALLPPMDLKPPTVRLSDLAIESATLQGLRLRATFRTENPNPIELPLSDVKFDLALFGQPIAQGIVPEPSFTIPANGAREVPIAFTVAASDLRTMLSRAANGPADDPTWQLKGSLRWGVFPIPLPFERRGDSPALRRLREMLRG